MSKFNIWSFWAKRYERLWVQKYSLGPTRREIVKEIKNSLGEANNKSLSILDMGCGTGQLLRDIQKEFLGLEINLTGVDMSQGMVEEAKKKSNGIIYIVSSVNDFNSQDKYDFITCSHSFPYYGKKEEVIEKFYSMLKEDGVLLLAQASANSFYDNLAMFFVKFTTSKAKYLNIKTLKAMTCKFFKEVRVSIIKEKSYMPTICLLVCSRRGENI